MRTLSGSIPLASDAVAHQRTYFFISSVVQGTFLLCAACLERKIQQAGRKDHLPCLRRCNCSDLPRINPNTNISVDNEKPALASYKSRRPRCLKGSIHSAASASPPHQENRTMASAATSTTTTSSSSRAPRPATAPKLTCLCSPTNHPGSFRCSRHRNNPRAGRSAPATTSGTGSGGDCAGQQQHRGRKGRSVRALLLQRISQSDDRGRQRRHRGDFQPRPSRLRLMNK